MPSPAVRAASFSWSFEICCKNVLTLHKGAPGTEQPHTATHSHTYIETRHTRNYRSERQCGIGIARAGTHRYTTTQQVKENSAIHTFRSARHFFARGNVFP